MSVDVAAGVHIPKNPNYFSFDEEVTAVFDNMAVRSLPGYEYVMATLTGIVARMGLGDGDSVWDMGVSTGRALIAARSGVVSPYVEYHGVDISEPMLRRCKEKCPWATLHHADLSDGSLPPAMLDRRGVKVVVFAWTLQFLPQHVREVLLKEVYRVLEPGGFLFVMEKWQHTCNSPNPPEGTGIPQTLQERYIDWRRDNGYGLDEIRAKNKALSNAMVVDSRADRIRTLVNAGFGSDDIFGLFQLYNFGGLVAQKRG